MVAVSVTLITNRNSANVTVCWCHCARFILNNKHVFIVILPLSITGVLQRERAFSNKVLGVTLLWGSSVNQPFFHFFPDTMRHAFDWLSFLTRKYFGSCSASRLFHSTKSCHQTNWAWCETSNCSTGFDRREKTVTATVACALIKNLCGVSKRMGGKDSLLLCFRQAGNDRFKCFPLPNVFFLLWQLQGHWLYRFSSQANNR